VTTLLIIPGLDGSGPDHWQSRWEVAVGDDAVRIQPASWTEPDLADWLAAIDRAFEPGMLVATHSLGNLAFARWIALNPGAEVAGALLVAPPDATRDEFPTVARPFAVDPVPLPVRSIVVASDDDPYASVAASTALAAGWGARLVVLEGHGHIGAESGVGDWPEGRALLAELDPA